MLGGDFVKFVEEFADSRLKSFLQKKLELYCQQDILYRSQLRSLRLCGTGAIRAPMWAPNAFVVSNGQKARFSMITPCRNPWACPECTVRVMAKKAENIACALDALATNYKQRAIMFTFTLPHVETMSCQETFELLRKTWQHFVKASSYVKKVYKVKSNFISRRNRNGEVVNLVAGEERTYYHRASIWAEFLKTFQIKHSVRVFEFTWGKNGWHPHIHALFWFPEELIDSDKILAYERELSLYWFGISKHEYLKILNHRASGKIDSLQVAKNKAWVNSLFSKARTSHNSVTISKRKNPETGKFEVILSESSSYITGWSSDKELTQLHLKHANNCHFTPFQLLQLAFKFDKKNPELSKKYFDLYLEYCLATFKKRRCDFSCWSGINRIIREWKESEGYIRTLKKKFTKDAEPKPKWKMVAYFTEQQWSEICSLDFASEEYIRTHILQLAKSGESAKDEIIKYLMRFNIDIRSNFEIPDSIYNRMKMIVEGNLVHNKISA